jgi:small conductance mechanosensitive channel
VTYSFEVLGAIIILIVGVLIGKWVSGFVLAICAKRKLDVTLSHFLASVVKILILVFAVIIAMGKFGITIAPFVAAIGAVAFGATYAIQGPLSNYGAGISIILGRPFVVGDTITVVGVSGVVQEVKLGATLLANAAGDIITIPNKHIVGEILYNSKANNEVDGCIGISYDSDPEKAIALVQDVLRQFPEVVAQPAPSIGIKEFSDSSINIGYRYWAPTVKCGQISAGINLAIFKAFQKAGIEIPIPQREIRIVSQPSGI